MYILINEQKIEITSKSVKRFNNDGHLLLTVVIPKENISAGDLDTLVTEIKENAPTIEVYENEEVVQTLTGFKLTPVFALSKDGLSWELSIENSSELEYQYGRLKDRADALEKSNTEQALVIADQAKTITAQGSAITAQASKILEQDKIIELQAEELTLLNETLLEMIMG